MASMPPYVAMPAYVAGGVASAMANRMEGRKRTIPCATAVVTAPTAGTTVSAPPKDTTPVVLWGAQGTSGLKLTKALLEAGFKVTAEIDFPEQAKSTLDFVKKYELVSRAQLANLKLAESPSQLPKRAKVVIFEGDTLGDSKTDARYLEAAVEAAVAADAAQVVLITSPAAATGSLFSFGSSPTQPNKSLSRSEQLLASSGLPFLVVRVATTSSKPASGEVPCTVVAGPGGVAPAAAPVNDETVAAVLSAALGQPATPAGLSVVLEVAALAPGAAQTTSLDAAIAAAISESKAKQPIPVLPPKASAPASAKKEAPEAPGMSFPAFSLGTMSIKRTLNGTIDADDEPPAQKAPAKPVAKPVAFKPAAKPVAKPSDDDEEEEDEEDAQPLGGFFAGLFAAAAPKAAEAKPTPAAGRPIPPAKPQPVARGGTTSIRVSVPPSAPAPVKARAPNPFSSISSRRPQADSAPAPTKGAPAKEAAEAPASGGGMFGFLGRAAAPKPPVAKVVEPPPAPAKAPNFFAFFFGKGKSDDDDEDEDDEPVRKPRAAPAKPAPKPAPKPVAKVPPPKPAPKPVPVAKVAAAPPARPSSNPFSSVKRVQSPAPPPARTTAKTPPPPPKPAPKAAPSQRTGTQQVKGGTTGTSVRGTYRPVSGYSVTPKK